MKRFLPLILIFILFFSRSEAQSWAKPGATWYYGLSNIWTTSGYCLITKTGTEVINGKTVDVLSMTYRAKDWNGNTVNGSFGNVFTYVDSNVVFFARDCDSIFHELYNFNKLQGDSFLVDSMTCYLNCGSSQTYVDSVSSEIINSTNSKVQYLSQQTPPYPKQVFGGKINSYFGGLTYFLPQGYCITDGDYISGLRCYSDSSGYLFSTLATNLSCDYIMAIKEIESKNNFSLYPNPANKELYVSFNNKHDVNLSIFNALGEKIYQRKNFKSATKIDVSNFKSGIYFLTLEDGENLMKTKFVVEN